MSENVVNGPEPELIGRLIPMKYGLRAKCAMCPWSVDSGDHRPGNAEKVLRQHVALAHPPTINVYRTVEQEATS